MMDSDKSSEDHQPSHQNDPVISEGEGAAQQMDELHLEKTTVNSITWNDAIFNEKYLPMAKISDKVTIADAIPAAKALLNWYVHGIKPKYSSDTILFVFYAMTIHINDSHSGINEEKNIFPSILMEGETFLKRPDKTEKIEEIKYTSPIRWPFEPDTPQSKPLQENKLTIKLWYNTLWEALDYDSEDMDEQNKQKQKLAINLIGFLYMNLQKLTVMNKEKVCERLTLEVFNSFYKLWGGTTKSRMIVDKIIPPTSTMVIDFVYDYKRYSFNSMRCLAAMVFAFGCRDEERTLPITQRILSAGCLQTLEFINLRIVQWTLEAIKDLYKFTYDDMIEYMDIERHHETNKALLNFSQCALDPGEFTWYWARMFSAEAFPKLDITDNPEYAMTMFSCSIENDPKNSLWNNLFARFDSTGATKKKALIIGSLIDLITYSKLCERLPTHIRGIYQQVCISELKKKAHIIDKIIEDCMTIAAVNIEFLPKNIIQSLINNDKINVFRTFMLEYNQPKYNELKKIMLL